MMSKILVAGLVLMSMSVFGQETFVLKCRPGPQTALNLNLGNNELRFGFNKTNGPAGANGEHLQPGQCAFLDRAVSAGEPAMVGAKVGPNFRIGAMVPVKSNNSFKAYMYAQNQAWVMQFATTDTILTIHVFNDGQVLLAPNP